jgi:Ran GTPase-activating protein (RanGAP) involved in mRNA processing and transport
VTPATRSLANLKLLVLQQNKISGAGIASFSDAIASGALPLLKELYLSGNKIGDDGVIELFRQIASGAPLAIAEESACIPLLPIWFSPRPRYVSFAMGPRCQLAI